MLHRASGKTVLLALCLLAVCHTALGQGSTIQPAAAPGTEPELRLIPDDALQLRVVGEDDLSGTYTVRGDGMVLLPIVNEVHVGGLTLAEATGRIREALAVPIINPQISLELAKPAPRRIYVAGEVLKPGVLEWKDAPSLAKALNLASGITERGDLRNVRLKRGQIEQTLDVAQLVREGDFRVDVALEPGDQILVPERPRVTILGPVEGAGVAYFEQGDTLYQLLSGRLETSPMELRYVRVVRGEETLIVNLETIRRSGDPTNDLPLQREDRIVVADRGEVFVSGRVSTPGSVDPRQGYTAARAILAAGGPLPDAALDRCVVIHEGQAREVDLAAVLAEGKVGPDVEVESGDLVVVPDNQVLVLGAVQKPSQYGLRWRCHLSDALASAGGPLASSDLRAVTILRDGKPAVVDVSALYDTGTLANDPTLSPDDVIVVPEAWVYLIGEAQKPGPVAYRQARTLRELLATAGGVTPNAKVDCAFVVRGEKTLEVSLAEAIRGGSREADIALEPSDRVVIPELLDERVYVTGVVTSPLAVRVEDAPDVARAIARAGGTTEGQADLSRVRVIRAGEALTVDMRAFYNQSDLSQNIALRPGDLVVVPRNEEGFVFVLGWVSRPGAVPHFDGIRLSQAIAEAGGVQPDGRMGEVLIARTVDGERQVLTVPFSALFKPEDTAPDRSQEPPTGTMGHVPAELQGRATPPPAAVAEERSEPDPNPVLLRGDIVMVQEQGGARVRRSVLPWLSEIGYWLGRIFPSSLR